MRNITFILVLLLIAVMSYLIYRNVSEYITMKKEPDEEIPQIDPLPPQKEIKFGDRLYMRLLKAEDKFELWFSSEGKPYELYKTYVICTYSGGLGPKKREGDKKSPEGFYSTTNSRLNPNSQYHLSFNIGYPNAYDKANGYTGSFIMVHGGCASIGCYAMTDPVITEIYGLVEQAFAGGQKIIPIHIFPFAMTENNMAQYQNSEHIDFWRMLKPAYDFFEMNHQVPIIDVSNKQYIIKKG